jgi:hypothetical protein
VLSESSTDFCVLKCFSKATPSAWGMVCTQISSCIPIFAVEGMKLITKKAARGKEFTIAVSVSTNSKKDGEYQTHRKTPPTLLHSPHTPSVQSRVPTQAPSQLSDSHSESSDFAQDDKTKVIHLRAADPQIRLLWMTMISRALEAAYEED